MAQAPLTIYDFGCRPSSEVWIQLLPALPGALACVALLALLAAAGRLLRRDQRFEAINILCGWAVVAVALTVVATLAPHMLLKAAWLLIGLMGVSTLFVIRSRYFVSPFWLAVVIAGIPVLLAINVTGIAKWDDFSHWVPNALYLYQHDALPTAAFPSMHSAWPGYPYALPFLTYLASLLAGGFLVQGGAMFNFLFLLTFAGMLVELYPSRTKATITLQRVGLMGLALLLVTLANPNFNASFTMTSQGDTGTMVVVAALGLAFWRLLGELKSGERAATARLGTQIALLNALLVLIRQSNVALAGLLVIAFLICAWKNGALTPAVRRLPAMLIGAVVLRLLWQHYVDAELAGNGFSFHPLKAWRFDLLGPLLSAMGREMLRKSGCFLLAFGVIVAGFVSLFRPASRVRDFVLLSAIVSAGYFVFLVICYLGATFSEMEVRRAASFFRYSTNIGLLGITSLWIAAPRLRDWLKERHLFPTLTMPQVLPTALCLAAPLLLPLSLAFDAHWLVAHPIPENCGYRIEARALAEQLPDNVRLAIFEPETDGMFSCITNFELALKDARNGGQTSVVWNVNMFNKDTFASRVDELKTNTDVDAVYIQQARQTPVDGLGHSNASAPVLLVREEAGWKQ
jgi:hypothetical protein